MLNKFLHATSQILRSPQIKPYLLKADEKLQQIGGKPYSEFHRKIREKIRYMGLPYSKPIEKQTFEEQCWNFDIPIPKDRPLVSVIVPNYNHEQYLRQRLDSIYQQSYKHFEVILLDDASTDSSRTILEEYAERYPENTVTVFNENNSGGKILNQWNKGLQLAKGDYIWIAESDDYCEETFLEALVPLLDCQSVMLAFCRSVFMENGVKIWSTEEYLSDLTSMRWDQPFTMSAHVAVQKAFCLKNMIPNVSSCIFRNIGKVPDDVMETCSDIKLCHDWIFYLSLIRGGCLSYTNRTTNFYRIHSGSTSLTVQAQARYYAEHAMVSSYILQTYQISEDFLIAELEILNKHYCAANHTSESPVKEWYQIEKIKKNSRLRMPNIVMCSFSMQLGGGETYPLYLANELKRLGAAVTLLDFRYENYQEDIRKLLHPSIPLVELSSRQMLYSCITQLGGEVAHSHHACVDEEISTWMLYRNLPCRQIITLHGMYETILKSDCRTLLEKVSKTCSQFIYIADKNLVPFNELGFYDSAKFIKLPNGLPMLPVHPIERRGLKIPEDAFVLCLISRGLPEKGWEEAIRAVEMANRSSSRPVHLVILGDGEERVRLESSAPETVHFMGTVNNVRDYLTMSDAGLLPTYFKGESYPLVLIESILCSRPVITTNIGEIKNQISSEDGETAGVLLELVQGKPQVEALCAAILSWINDPVQYNHAKDIAIKLQRKFDINKIAKQYLEIYRKSIGTGGQSEP